MSDDLAECRDCDHYWIGDDAFQAALDHARDIQHRVTVHATL